MSASSRQTVLVWLAIGALALFSVGLSLGRIYQVDEAQNLYMARVAAWNEAGEFFTTAAIHLVPLGWLTKLLSTSVAIFTVARLLFLAVFWLNIWLMARATGARMGGTSGAWATLAAATIAPLWDYGIEVRHDNLLLSGLLGMWILGRPGGARAVWRICCVGFLASVLQFVAMKAVLYTASISLLTLLLSTAPRWRMVAAWLVGVIAGFACVRGLYALTGLWRVHLDSYRELARVERAGSAMHVFTLERLVAECPVIVAATAVSILYVLYRIVTRRANLNTVGVAETLLLFLAVAAFAANPTPFPYNLVLLVPFAYLLVARVLLASAELIRVRVRGLVWLIAFVMVTHGATFARASARHLAWDNSRQQALMVLAESMTDPARDRVYDASGLVVSRRATQRWWYLHSLNMPAYGTAQFPVLSEVLAQRPAAVILRSYRTDWLFPEDARFMAAHYVPIADDFWVLGTVTSGRSRWECLQEGRYWLQVTGTADRLRDIRLDGVKVSPGVLTVSKGPHELLVAEPGSAALVWIGSRLPSLPSLAQRDHTLLFVNWY